MDRDRELCTKAVNTCLRLVMTPSSQELESPGNPGRFKQAAIVYLLEENKVGACAIYCW